MQEEHVVSISPNGHVRSMHSDKFPLGFLGPQTINRASDIRWDEDKQSWGIWFSVNGEFARPPSVYSGFDTYDTARRFEVMMMNECMKHELSPLHPTIKMLATSWRF